MESVIAAVEPAGTTVPLGEAARVIAAARLKRIPASNLIIIIS